jgi:hypothetical protein
MGILVTVCFAKIILRNVLAFFKIYTVKTSLILPLGECSWPADFR